MVQETTAAFLTAALAKQTASGSSEVASPEQVRAGTHVSTSTTYDATPSVGAAQLLHSETKEIVNSNKDASEVSLYWLRLTYNVNCILPI